MVVLFLQTDLGGGGGGPGAKAGPRQGPRSGGGYSSAAGRTLESVKAVPPPDQPPPLAGVRWVSRQGVPGGTLPRVPGRGICARHAASMPVPGRSAPQTTRLHQCDHKAAAGRRCRCRFGPGFRCHLEQLTDRGRKVS